MNALGFCVPGSSDVLTYFRTLRAILLPGPQNPARPLLKLAVVPFAIALALSSANAADKPHVTGIYSDLKHNEETGDLSGTEIFIVVGADGYEAFVQISEGQPGPTATVPVKVDGETVSFEVDQPSFKSLYRGRITPVGLVGTLTVTNKQGTSTMPLKLRRKNSYWQ